MAKPARVAAHDRREIKALPDQRHDQPRKVVPRHIVLHPRRQQLHIVDLPGAKFLAHNHAWNQTLHNLTSHYSDRLLAGGLGHTEPVNISPTDPTPYYDQWKSPGTLDGFMRASSRPSGRARDGTRGRCWWPEER